MDYKNTAAQAQVTGFDEAEHARWQLWNRLGAALRRQENAIESLGDRELIDRALTALRPIMVKGSLKRLELALLLLAECQDEQLQREAINVLRPLAVEAMDRLER